MSRRNTHLLKAALAAVHYSGAESFLGPFTKGVGVIFMLHHVRPEPPQAFEPNRILKVTPDFLETVVVSMLESGFDVVSLDEVPSRLRGGHERPFACFTFDDGYCDNRDYAYPIFKRHRLPFAVYVPTDFADGRGDFWWLTLEKVLRVAPHITLAMNGEGRHFSLTTVSQKEAAYREIYWWLRSIPEDLARAAVAELADTYHVDPHVARAGLVMSWDELRAFTQDPLVTIGAHTKSHLALGKLSESEARAQMAESIARIEVELDRPCRHFSYPYGCANSAGPREFEIAKELGVVTAVTTRKGLLYPEHAEALTALPRLSLNGDFQDIRYVKALLSGVPFALMHTFQRLSGHQRPA
jgi:peptidoglycan/xylan/chitin deacetylase (PgdA/CDA1 family)